MPPDLCAALGVPLGTTRLDLCAWLYTLATTRLDLCAWLYTLGTTRLDLCAWLLRRTAVWRAVASGSKTFPFGHQCGITHYHPLSLTSDRHRNRSSKSVSIRRQRSCALTEQGTQMRARLEAAWPALTAPHARDATQPQPECRRLLAPY